MSHLRDPQIRPRIPTSPTAGHPQTMHCHEGHGMQNCHCILNHSLYIVCTGTDIDTSQTYVKFQAGVSWSAVAEPFITFCLGLGKGSSNLDFSFGRFAAGFRLGSGTLPTGPARKTEHKSTTHPDYKTVSCPCPTRGANFKI